jgi:septal ring factor EnvC (AmiA/AmiB activator)
MVTAIQTYGKIARELAEIDEEIQDAEGELEAAEERVSEAENDIYNLKKKREKLQKEAMPQDLSASLPTPLKQRGYRLTTILAKLPHPQNQIPLIPYTEPVELFRFTILENNAGDVVKQWDGTVSIAEILEAS